MDENTQVEQQAVQSEPVEQVSPSDDTTRPVSESQPTVTESLKEALGESSDSSQSVAPETQKGGDDTEKTKTRYERRVEGLIDKLKTATQQQPDAASLYGNEPLFTKEEIESGTFDPNALQQRLAQREERVQQLASQQALAAVEYRSAVNDHLSDIDTVQKEMGDDPVLDKLVAKQYDALNHQINPLTGQKVFVPQVKMSEIYKEMKEALDKKSTQAAADVSVKLSEQAHDQAVPISVSDQPSEDFATQEAFSKASRSGQVEDWAEVLKNRLKSK